LRALRGVQRQQRLRATLLAQYGVYFSGSAS